MPLKHPISGDGYLGSTIDISGKNGDNSLIPGASPGGYAGGAVNERASVPRQGYPRRPQEGQVMGEPVHTPLRIRAELMEMVKSPAAFGGSGGGGLLSIRLVVVVVAALAVDANGSLTVDTSILALGGNGMDGGIECSGGSIRLSADNHLNRKFFTRCDGEQTEEPVVESFLVDGLP